MTTDDDPTKEFDASGGQTDPEALKELELIRHAYVEHGKKLGALEQRLEEVHKEIREELDYIKDRMRHTANDVAYLYEKQQKKED